MEQSTDRTHQAVLVTRHLQPIYQYTITAPNITNQQIADRHSKMKLILDFNHSLFRYQTTLRQDFRF